MFYNLEKNFHKLKKILLLSFSLAKTNFKLRNEGSYLGIFWYLLLPLSLFVIILLVRSAALSDIPIEHYELYLLFGITGFNFFRQSISLSISSIYANGGFLKSLNGISVESFVISQFIESMFSHFFEILLIIGFMLYYGVPIFWIIFYPVVFFLFAPFVLGLSFIFATAGTYMRDLENVWNVLSQLIFFGTPIFYIANPNSLGYKINVFNPLFYFLSMARDVIIYHTFPSFWMPFMLFIVGVFVLFVGIIIFKKFCGRFAELV